MNEPIRINVSFETTPATLRGNICVEGAPDELFIAAVTRAVRERLSHAYGGGAFVVWWADPDYPEVLTMMVPDAMTMAATREYFGDEADASPPTIGVKEAGFGGDSNAAGYFIELVRTGVDLVGYVSLTLAAQREVVKARYGRARQLAKDWNDGDYIAPELREVVRAKLIWRRQDLDKVFGLGPSRGPLLFRRLGYERVDMPWGEEWHRTLNEDA